MEDWTIRGTWRQGVCAVCGIFLFSEFLCRFVRGREEEGETQTGLDNFTFMSLSRFIFSEMSFAIRHHYWQHSINKRVKDQELQYLSANYRELQQNSILVWECQV